MKEEVAIEDGKAEGDPKEAETPFLLRRIWKGKRLRLMVPSLDPLHHPRKGT